jgi:hypothetical protein
MAENKNKKTQKTTVQRTAQQQRTARNKMRQDLARQRKAKSPGALRRKAERQQRWLAKYGPGGSRRQPVVAEPVKPEPVEVAS